ncbi:conserved exported protein of unknown function [Rhodovastum atsumiense]|uniref:DUF4189 domain-containing protein n=1 Tax=Rhodovastum atsumiense TaxID=504468 RepID=A0A5M6IUU0_9PROT|nr:DUF4189 domain-containing protein [Rhodovastum atsumiense]KAA5612032.1 DUF4189 domain-containing protein [Rhodovastum atsumiense]CAH2604105.1 conserved exported protein of unknown function [Rhodovastum atsumiense]
MLFRLAAVSFVLLATAAGPGEARADGAIAYGGNGRVGFSYDEHPRAAAARALEDCGYQCRIVARFSNACASVAISPDGGYGYAIRDHQRRADIAAVENCRDYGNRGCRIEMRGCDER